MIIELPQQLEFALASEAARRGTTPDALAAEFIQSQLNVREGEPAATTKTSEEPAQQTLYDRWKEHLAEVERASLEARGPTNLSQDTGRRFAELLQQRRQQGRL